MYQKLTTFIQDYYQSKDFIPLHTLQFSGNEKKYLIDTIDNTFVSSIAQYVDQFEQQISNYTGCDQAAFNYRMPRYQHATKRPLPTSVYLESRVVNLPSSPIMGTSLT